MHRYKIEFFMKSLTSIEPVRSFSFWLILASGSIITSGWLLSHLISQTIPTEQKLTINVRFLKIQATGSEVLLGFGGFIITTLLSGCFGGKWIYELVKTGFGLNLGQFYSICMFSSFLTVAWSFSFFIIYYIFKQFNLSFIENPEQYEDLIHKMSQRSKGRNNGK